MALTLCLVVFVSNMYGCLVGEVVFSRGRIEVNSCCGVGFIIGCCCLVDVYGDLILCFSILIVCCGAKARDIILRIF